MQVTHRHVRPIAGIERRRVRGSSEPWTPPQSDDPSKLRLGAGCMPFSGASDSMSSEQEEVFGGLAGEPMDRCYHLSYDELPNLDECVLETLANALARAVVSLAHTPVTGEPR